MRALFETTVKGLYVSTSYEHADPVFYPVFDRRYIVKGAKPHISVVKEVRRISNKELKTKIYTRNTYVFKKGY